MATLSCSHSTCLGLGPCVFMRQYLVSGVGTALGDWRGGAQLDGLGFMEDHCGQRLFPQCQHIQLGLEHSLKVLKKKSKEKCQ